MRAMLIPLVCLATASAAAENSGADWIEELSARYAAHSGFIAIYHCVGEGKSLDATLALDETSRLSSLHVNVIKNGDRLEFKHWNTSCILRGRDGSKDVPILG